MILYYVKGDEAVWNDIHQEYEEGYVAQYYRYADDDGRRFMSGDISAAGLKGGGYTYEWKGVTRTWRVPESTMRRLDDAGRIFYTRNAIPRIKRYLDEAEGLPIQDVWTDIEALRSWHEERLEYPTQKPEELLDRVVEASSNPGDLILDPFCGCGTAVAVAQRLGRAWVGIDITHLATNLIKWRLKNAGLEPRRDQPVIGEPTDLPGAQQLAEDDRHQFQSWALGLVGARTTEGSNKGADRGIDGRLFFQRPDKPGAKTKQIIFSVKSGGVSVVDIRDLRGVIEREEAEIGVPITLEQPTQPMNREAAEAGFYNSPFGNIPCLQILTVEELLNGKAIQTIRLHPSVPIAHSEPLAGNPVSAREGAFWQRP